MTVHRSFIFFALFLVLNSFSGIPVDCATYENVTVILTSRYVDFYVNDTAPAKPVLIHSDDGLAEYVNNQPLDIIVIENQNIPELREKSVANLPNISDIAITSSGIKEIQPGTFGNLPKLEYLNLSGNLLEEIKDGVFTNLELDSLHLENNKISKLGNKAFNDMKMKHLFIDDNRISTWKSDWFTGTPLNSISMGHNLLEELPANAFEYYLKFKTEDNPLSLWYFQLDNNKLKKINADAFKGLEELLYLNLQNNSLEQLPPDVFRSVKYINNLELNDNKITNIDVAEVFKNTRLTYVKLQNNQLSCFPVEIVNVTEIYNVKVDGNPLTCECVKSWEKWQENKTEKVIPDLSNIKENCVN